MAKFWLMKSEPDVFSIDDLKRDKTTPWEGVRNYQARNFMMNEMSVGDLVLFYHSNTTPPGIAGVAKVVSPAKPDKLQFDKKGEYYDPKAKADHPRWFCVDVGFESKFKNFISLESLRSFDPLANMLVLKKGQRLSIQPVTEAEFSFILDLGQR